MKKPTAFVAVAAWIVAMSATPVVAKMKLINGKPDYPEVGAEQPDLSDELVKSQAEVTRLKAELAQRNRIPEPAAPGSGRPDLQQLLHEEGVAIKPGETGYDALQALFEKGQAPSQADVTGSFSGQTFRDITPDQGSPYGLVGQEVAGTVSRKFELVFSNQDKNPEDGDLALSRLLPDYRDSETSVVFENSDVKVKWQPGGVLPGAPVYRNLKVRKVGPCLVAAEQVDHLLIQQKKPDWLGYFCRK